MVFSGCKPETTEEVSDIMKIAYKHLFGELGITLINESYKLQNDPKFILGMTAGGQDSFKVSKDNEDEIPYLALHLLTGKIPKD